MRHTLKPAICACNFEQATGHRYFKPCSGDRQDQKLHGASNVAMSGFEISLGNALHYRRKV